MVATRQQQMGLQDEALESPELEKLLDERESAKEQLKPYRKRFNKINGDVKEKLEGMELADGTYRVGEFIVKISEAEEKHIEFDRASSKRISITVAKT